MWMNCGIDRWKTDICIYIYRWWYWRDDGTAIDQVQFDTILGTKMLFGNHRKPLDKLAVKVYSILLRLIKLCLRRGKRRHTELCTDGNTTTQLHLNPSIYVPTKRNEHLYVYKKEREKEERERDRNEEWKGQRMGRKKFHSNNKHTIKYKWASNFM